MVPKVFEPLKFGYTGIFIYYNDTVHEGMQNEAIRSGICKSVFLLSWVTKIRHERSYKVWHKYYNQQQKKRENLLLLSWLKNKICWNQEIYITCKTNCILYS